MGKFFMNTYDVPFIDLNIIQCGYETCEPGHTFGPAKRDHYLFHYILSGGGILESELPNRNTAAYSLSEDQGFLIYPNQTATYTADLENPWDYLWIEFDGLRVKENFDSVGITPAQPVYTSDNDGIRQLMLEEMKFITEHPKAPVLQIIGHLYLFFDYLLQSREKTVNKDAYKIKDFYVRSTIEYIGQNYKNKISVADIAAKCGIDRSYLCKLFHKSVGKSPGAYLMQYRMIQACSLLKETELPVSTVARECGYDNPLNFSRSFKKVLGVSPRNWRNANK